MPTRRRSVSGGGEPAKKAPAKKAPAKAPAKAPSKAAAKATPGTAAKQPGRGALPAGEDPTDVQVAKLQVALEERSRERDELASRLSASEEKLAELQKAESTRSEELGRLREVASTLDAVTQERATLKERLDALQVDLPSRIEEQLAARLKEVTAAQAAEVRALQEERDRLRARVEELELPRSESATSMTTSALATHFADLLAKVAEVPAASPNAAYAASVTGFSVSAKGVLRATDSGDVELVMPDPGTVPADTLSTLNLDLKLLPRLGTPAAEG